VPVLTWRLTWRLNLARGGAGGDRGCCGLNACLLFKP
jgi:hypothetical protein